MVYFVYVLLSQKDRQFYIGITDDLMRRFGEHNRGNVASTKYRRPLKLLCCEVYKFKQEALRREKYLKSSDGKKELKIRLKESIQNLTNE